MYTIKRASEMVGVPVATLRAWQRRYEWSTLDVRIRATGCTARRHRRTAAHAGSGGIRMVTQGGSGSRRLGGI